MLAGKDDGKQRRGLLGKGAAILVDSSDTIYTLDEKKNEIQVFRPTEFTNTLHQALDLYQNGRYVESKEPWTDVLNMNSQFDFANLGIGESYYKEEDYPKAMTSFRRAKNKNGYSDAFWEVRNVWIREHIIQVVGFLIVLAILFKIIKQLLVKTNGGKKIRAAWNKVISFKLIREVRYLGYYWLHPLDGTYGIRKERKTSNLSAFIIGILATVIYVVNKYYTGFTFRNTKDGVYTLAQDVSSLGIAFFAIVIATYLVCTISDGSTTFRQLTHGMVYSLGPYIFIKPFVILLSNGLTLNEEFILQISNVVIYTWIVILIFLSIKELNEYSFGQTVRIIFLSVFTLFIAALSLFILYSLFQQLFSFIASLYGEVVHRFES